jgi:Uncharacterized conserved protein
MLFGEYELLDKLELEIPGGMLVFEKTSGNNVRISKIVSGLKSSKLTSLTHDSSVVLKAVPPLGGPISSHCVYVVLPEPIVLSEGTRLQYELKIPVDLGVFLGGVLVDVVPLGKVKYALYGPSDLGDMCRYVDAKILESYGIYVARARVSFRSQSSVRTEITKLIVPAKDASVYLTEDNELYLSDIDVNVLSPLHIEVRVGAETSFIVLGKLISFLKGSGAIYVMKYGG